MRERGDRKNDWMRNKPVFCSKVTIVIVGVLAPRGVRAGTDAGRTRAAEGHGRRLILCTRNRTDPISGFANNGDAPDDLTSGFTVKHIGGVYPDDEHATDCIDNDRTFFCP